MSGPTRECLRALLGGVAFVERVEPLAQGERCGFGALRQQPAQHPSEPTPRGHGRSRMARHASNAGDAGVRRGRIGDDQGFHAPPSRRFDVSRKSNRSAGQSNASSGSRRAGDRRVRISWSPRPSGAPSASAGE